MGRFQQQRFLPDGGLNEDENPHAVDDKELTECLNVWRRGETVGTRPGVERTESTEYDAQIGSSPTVQGIVEFARSVDTLRNVVVMAGGEAKLQDDVSMDKAADSVTLSASNDQWTFAQHKNNLYAAGGAILDDAWYVVGTGTLSASSQLVNLSTAGPANDSGTRLNGKFIFQKWNRLFMCRFYQVGTSTLETDFTGNPMTIRFSALNDGTVWPDDNFMGGTSAIGGFSADGDEMLNGFGEFTDNNGDWLLALSNKRLYAIQETGDPLIPFFTSRIGSIANGCVHQNAFVNLGLDTGEAIYLSNHGIHSLRQSQQFGAQERTFLSWKIRKTFDTINQDAIEIACGTYWRKQGLVLFAVPTGASTVNDTILALDVKGITSVDATSARWYVWRLAGVQTSFGVSAMAPVRRLSDKDIFIYAGNYTGDVFRFNDSVNSDLGVAFTSSFTTKHNDFQAPGTTKVLGDAYVEIQPGGAYSPQIQPVFDYGGRSGRSRPLNMGSVSNSRWGPGSFTMKWTTGKWAGSSPTFLKKLYMTGGGNTVGFKIQHTGANEPFYIASLGYQVEVQGEEVGD